MTAAGASNADRQIRLPFTFIKRQKIPQHVGEASDRFADFRVLSQKRADLRMLSRKVLQRRLEVWIREMPDVEKQVQIARISKLVTEADDENL